MQRLFDLGVGTTADQLAEGVVINLRAIWRRKLVILKDADTLARLIWAQVLETVAGVFENVYLISLHDSVAVGGHSLIFSRSGAQHSLWVAHSVEGSVCAVTQSSIVEGVGVWAHQAKIVFILLVFFVFEQERILARTTFKNRRVRTTWMVAMVRGLVGLVVNLEGVGHGRSRHRLLRRTMARRQRC